jgi:hypothetical protein
MPRTSRKPPSAEVKREIMAVLASSASRHALTFHSIGGDGEKWPAWLRAYERACGAYVIRDKSSKSVLYVGSSTSRLYDTISRHFQQWGRQKRFWKEMRGAHHDPGMTYARGRCEVAVRLVACGKERDEEASLIAKLSPRDNLTENPGGE